MAVVAQMYLIYKSAIFMFVSDCQKIYNTLATWRTQLSYSLDGKEFETESTVMISGVCM